MIGSASHLLWGFVLAILIVVVGDMFSEEIRTRLERLPHRLIDLSGLLVTAHLREEMVDEWHAELDFVLRRTNGRPLTRLWRGTRYALSILGIVPNLEWGEVERIRRVDLRLSPTRAPRDCGRLLDNPK